MNEELIQILKRLESDKSVVVHLYTALYKSSFIVLVNQHSNNQEKALEFLTYPSFDNIYELPIFTSQKFVINFSPTPEAVQIQGASLWPQLLDVSKTGELEVAVDPGQDHGIRINREMILGMIVNYAV